MEETRTNAFGTVAAVKSAESYSKMAEGLNRLNTARGGEKGLKGFAFEEMYAADARLTGHTCEVINNNGAADLLLDGEPVQLKMGYKGNTPKWSDGYETVIVDKGNSELARKARKAGYKVEESGISNVKAQKMSDAMRMESAITKQSTAPLTGTLASSHMAGKAAAELTAKVGVPFQAGVNLWEVVNGEKSIEEAVVDTVVDGAVSVGTAYAGGAALTAASTAASAMGAAVAETAAGSSLMGAASTIAAAAAETAAGGAALTAASTAGAAVTTVVSTVAAAPVLPIVLVGVGLGFLGGAVLDLF